MRESLLARLARPVASVLRYWFPLLCIAGVCSCAQFEHRCATRPCATCGPVSSPDYFATPGPSVARPAVEQPMPPARRAAALRVEVNGPTSTRLNENVRYTLDVANTGEQAATGVVLRYSVPSGLRYVDATPPARLEPDAQEGQVLAWDLGTFGGGQQQRFSATFVSEVSGRLLSRAEVTSAESLRATASAATEVSEARLRVEMRGPKQAAVGESVTFDIVIINDGNVPAIDLVLVDTFDEGFVYDYQPRPDAPPMPSTEPIELFKERVPALARLGPGQRQSYPLMLRGTRAGLLRNQVTVMAEGGLEARADVSVEFQRAALAVSVIGPHDRFEGQPAEFNITVTNTGDALLRDVRLTDYVPDEMSYLSAGQMGFIQGDRVEWNLGDLAPGQTVRAWVELNADQVVEQTVNRVTATSEGALPSQAEAVLQIRARPFGLDTYMFDLEDMVSVGDEITYEIRVTNRGGEAARRVTIQAKAPREMQLVADAHRAPPEVAVRQQGDEVAFGPADLEAGAAWVFHVRARAVAPNPAARFQVQFSVEGLQLPIREEEPTTILPSEPSP